MFGVTVIELVVSPVLHAYVPPPVAVNVVDVPDTMVTSVPAFAVGPGLFTAVAIAVAVQPLLGSVTVTVYVPAAFTVGLDVVPPLVIPTPDQLYVAPVVVELALTVPTPVVQLIGVDVPAVTFGAALFALTDTVVVAVHPLFGSVTVTVYVPAALTVGVAVVPPLVIPAPVQLNVAPLVVELALIVPLDAAHVSVKDPPAVTAGAVVLLVTPTVVVDVHEVAGSVTVTVYVPTAFTVAVALEPPLTIPGPDHEYVAVPVVELALIVPVNGEQPNTNGEPAVAVGGVGTAFTTAFADAVEVHVPLSTVKV